MGFFRGWLAGGCPLRWLALVGSVVSGRCGSVILCGGIALVLLLCVVARSGLLFGGVGVWGSLLP